MKKIWHCNYSNFTVKNEYEEITSIILAENEDEALQIFTDNYGEKDVVNIVEISYDLFSRDDCIEGNCVTFFSGIF